MECLDHFARSIGLAFQIADDVLDVTQTSATLGKTAGKDLAVDKSTYVRHLGLDGARAEAENLLAAALDGLGRYGDSADGLAELAKAMVRRSS
jgi:geranylgeranyl pyrophosphate synthase